MSNGRFLDLARLFYEQYARFVADLQLKYPDFINKFHDSNDLVESDPETSDRLRQEILRLLVAEDALAQLTRTPPDENGDSEYTTDLEAAAEFARAYRISWRNPANNENATTTELAVYIDVQFAEGLAAFISKHMEEYTDAKNMAVLYLRIQQINDRGNGNQ